LTTLNKLRVVVDTNIIFSGLYDLNSGAGKLLIFAVEDKVELIASEYTKNEIERNLKEKLDYSKGEFRETIKALPIKWIDDGAYSKEMEKAEKLISHKKDPPILALALHTNSNIVSGDRHFHQVNYKGLKCWKLKELISHIESPKSLL